MKIVGSVNLAGGVNRADGNMLFPVIHKGDIFPVAPVPGQLFYRTDLGSAYVSNGTSWEQAGGGDVRNPMTSNLSAGGWNIGSVDNLDVNNVIASTVSARYDIVTSSTSAFYFGDMSVDGTWRIVRSGNDLVFERRESGSWVTKQTISA